MTNNEFLDRVAEILMGTHVWGSARAMNYVRTHHVEILRASGKKTYLDASSIARQINIRVHSYRTGGNPRRPIR